MLVLQKSSRLVSRKEAVEIAARIPKTGETMIETIKYTVASYGAHPRAAGAENIPAIRAKMKALGITEFEATQLLDICPATVLDVYVVVERLEERIEEEGVEELLRLFKCADRAEQ